MITLLFWICISFVILGIGWNIVEIIGGKNCLATTLEYTEDELSFEAKHSDMLRNAMVQYNKEGVQFSFSQHGKTDLLASVKGTAAFVDPETGVITPEKITNAVKGLKSLRLEGLYRIRFDFGGVSCINSLDVFETEGVQLVLDHENEIPLYVQFPIEVGTDPTIETLDKVCAVLVGMDTPWGAFVVIPIRYLSDKVVAKKSPVVTSGSDAITVGSSDTAITIGSSGVSSSTAIRWSSNNITLSIPNSLTEEELALLENVLTEGVTDWRGDLDTLRALKIIWNLRKS